MYPGLVDSWPFGVEVTGLDNVVPTRLGPRRVLAVDLPIGKTCKEHERELAACTGMAVAGLFVVTTTR